MTFIPTGWYTITINSLVLIGVILAFTKRDRSMWWAAAAMFLSVIAARSATALADATLPILLVATPILLLMALQGRNRASYVIAAVYLPRVACYGLYAAGLIPLWAMWEFSNAFLLIQIGALWAGSLSGGHMVKDLVSGGGYRIVRSVPRTARFRDRHQ